MKRFAALCLLGIALAAYLSGSMDKTLEPIGLNLNECATNGLGVTFCGDDLERYEERVVRPTRDAVERVQPAPDLGSPSAEDFGDPDYLDGGDGQAGNCMSQGGDQPSC